MDKLETDDIKELFAEWGNQKRRFRKKEFQKH